MNPVARTSKVLKVANLGPRARADVLTVRRAGRRVEVVENQCFGRAQQGVHE